MNKAFITKVENDLSDRILSAFEWIGWEEIIRPDSNVFVKVNLTWPIYKQGVTTSPVLVDALLSVLKTRTKNISICESDGGNHSYKAEETFKGHNLYNICNKHDVNLVNLSKLPSRIVNERINNKQVSIPLPAPFLEKDVVFITVPVLKTHCMTGISVGMKNQWGCIPDTMRLLHHHVINEALVLINRLLDPKIVLIDALYAQDGNGPLLGEAIKMDTIIATNGIAASEPFACKLMGVDLQNIDHLALAKKEGMLADFDKIDTNSDLSSFRERDFRATRIWLDYISYALFKRHWASKLVYDSLLTKAVYFGLNLVREDPMASSKKALADESFEKYEPK